MRITDIAVDVVRDPHFAVVGDASLEAVIVRVMTDEGITGIGDACSSPHVVRSIIQAPSYFTLSRAFRELLVGRDPFEVAALWEEVYRLTHYPGRRGAYIHALGAVDVALWDIIGKATGQPVYKLLGGAFQRAVPAYASLVMPGTPEEVRRLAAETVAAGWQALKLGWFPYDTSAASDLAMVRAAREGAGPATTLMLDPGPRWTATTGGRSAVQLWDAKTAMQRIRRWEEYAPFWVEDPLPPDDVEGYRRLTAAVETYITAGEMESTRFPLYDLMDRGAIDILAIDVSRVGGLTEARRVVHAAQDRNKPVVTHCYSTALALAASLHLLAAAPTALYLEYTMSESSLVRDLFQPRLEVRDGMVQVPERPGLGVEVDDDLLAHLRVG